MNDKQRTALLLRERQLDVRERILDDAAHRIHERYLSITAYRLIRAGRAYGPFMADLLTYENPQIYQEQGGVLYEDIYLTLLENLKPQHIHIPEAVLWHSDDEWMMIGIMAGVLCRQWFNYLERNGQVAACYA